VVTGSLEVETKYEVDGDAVLPALTELPDVARESDPDVHHLDATYFDTDDLRLARAGITLRRRTGGDDDGWHLKLPVDGGRHELRAASGRSARTPPIALRRIVAGVVRDRSLVAVAGLRTERRVVSLLDEGDAVLAMVCDDRVQARRLGGGDQPEQTWREWELEVRGGRRKLTKAAHARLRAAGAQRSAHGSELARALTTSCAAPERPTVAADERASERDLLHQHLVALAAELNRLDPLVRADLPDAVHLMRVACRRLRSILRTFEKSFDAATTDPVRGDLKWLIDELGRPRDVEVLHGRLGEMLAAEQPDLVRGNARRSVDRRLRAAYRSAHKEAAEAMASPRYAELVDTLETWAENPPWSDRRDRRARRKLARAVAREWARTEKAAAVADAAAGEPDHAARLHEVRMAAKRTRYAAEALAPVWGDDATRLASAVTRIQRTLGRHHDTAVAADEVNAMAETAGAEGEDTFTYGVLRARLDQDLVRHERDYRLALRKAREPRLRRWLR